MKTIAATLLMSGFFADVRIFYSRSVNHWNISLFYKKLLTFEYKIKFPLCIHQMKVESYNLIYLSGFW